MAKEQNDLITMKEAAELAGVSYRTISRWVQLGYLTRKTAPRGQVRLSRKAVVAMNTFEDEPASAK